MLVTEVLAVRAGSGAGSVSEGAVEGGDGAEAAAGGHQRQGVVALLQGLLSRLNAGSGDPRGRRGADFGREPTGEGAR